MYYFVPRTLYPWAPFVIWEDKAQARGTAVAVGWCLPVGLQLSRTLGSLHRCSLQGSQWPVFGGQRQVCSEEREFLPGPALDV